MANEAANRLKYLMAQGDVDFSADVFKIILMESGFSFDRDAHHEYADVSGNELPTGNGYTAGGITLAGVAVTEDDANDRTTITWNNVSWVASGGPIGPSPGAIILDDTDANDSLVGYIDFGAEYTQADGGTATVTNIEVRVG